MRLGLLGGLAMAVALMTAGPATADPACLGAASRDAAAACSNPELRLLVSPTPDEALLTPNRPCDTVTQGTPPACAYGVRPRSAAAEVAVLGDSHAQHWRPALQYAAKRLSWHVSELAMSQCPFTAAHPRTRPGSHASYCPGYNGSVLGWLNRHPEVHTVFVSALAHVKVVAARHETEFWTRVDGYLAAWALLPASVTKIVVLHDDPEDRLTTAGCVRRAIAAQRPAGRACRVRRDVALGEDAQATAADFSQRDVDVLDFTPQFCGPQWCFPVVGGVLVHRDRDHLTQRFAETLGPILAREVIPLLGYEVPSAATARSGLSVKSASTPSAA